MARTSLAVTQITVAGTTPSYSAADSANGMALASNNGNTWLHVKNTGGSPCTVTLTTPYTVGGVAVTDPTVSVIATSGDKLIGPLDPTVFNQADGTVYVDFSTSSGVTVAAFRLT